MKITKLLVGGILLLGSCKSMDCGCPMAERTVPIQKKIVHSNTVDYSLNESDEIVQKSDRFAVGSQTASRSDCQ